MTLTERLITLLTKEHKCPLFDGILSGVYEPLEEVFEIIGSRRHEKIAALYNVGTYPEEGPFGGVAHREYSDSPTYSTMKALVGLGVIFTCFLPAYAYFYVEDCIVDAREYLMKKNIQ